MTEKLQKTGDNEDLSTKVKNWVEKQGYSLEMRVAKRFQENGFAVSQFEHFVDQESHAVRPVDVVASLSKDMGNTRIVIKLYIECKYSDKDKPWVIVVTPDKFDKFAYFSRVLKGYHPSNWNNIDTVQGRVVAKIVQTIDINNTQYPFLITNPGYVVAESLSNSKDHAYEAIIQISKSVEAHDTEAEETYKQTTQTHYDSENIDNASNFGLFISVAIPVVVINGQLFESFLAKDNEVEVAEIESGMVFVPYRRHETNLHSQVILSPVTVVAEKYLDNYVSLIKQGVELMLSQTEAINDVIEFEKANVKTPHEDVDF